MTKLNSLSKLALVVSAVAAFSIGCNNNPPATTSTSSSGGSSSGGTTSGGSSSGGSSSGGTTGASGTATLTLTPNTQAFGSVAQGGSSTPAIVFTVKNTGTAVSGPVSVTVTGNNEADFVPSANTCSGTLAASASCTVSITFSPSTTGNEAATLTATATPGGSVSASLTGSGVAPGGITVSPSSFPFATTVAGQVSAAQVFTFTNTGASTTASPTVALFGGDTSQFTIGADTCTGTPIAASGTCTVSVTFSPLSAGSFASSVQLTAGTATSSAAITGTGIAGAHLSISGSSSFGSQVENVASSPLTFTVTNQGGVATAALVDSPLTGANAADFAVGTDSCAGQVLQPSTTCQIQVTFDPSTSTAETATLTVTDGATDTAAVTLTGSGVSANGLTILPNPVPAFSSQVGTASAPTQLTVSNATGAANTGALTITISNPVFTIAAGSNSCTSLAGGASCTLSVIFTPTAAGAVPATTLTVTGAAGASTTDALSGTGIAPASLNFSQSALGFGSVAENTTSATQSVTVTNPGGAATGNLTVGLGGTNANDFAITGDTCSGQSLAAGTGSCTITVDYHPTLTGNEVAQINVSAAPGGSGIVSLSGAGITPSSLSFGATSFYTWAGVSDVGYQNAAVAFTLTNNGTQATGAIALSITGAQTSFAIVAPTGGDCVSGTTSLSNGQSCTIHVNFIPTAADLAGTNGVSSLAQSLVATPASGNPLSAPLSGKAANSMSYDVNLDSPNTAAPTAVSTSAGIASAEQCFYFYNQSGYVGAGTAHLDPFTTGVGVGTSFAPGTLSPVLSGSTDFQVSGGGSCTLATASVGACAGATLTANHSCFVAVKFNPSSTTAGYTSSVTLTFPNAKAGTTAIQADSFKITGTLSSPLSVQDSFTASTCTFGGSGAAACPTVTAYGFDTEGSGTGKPGGTATNTTSVSSTLELVCATGNCGIIHADLTDQQHFAVVGNTANPGGLTGHQALTLSFTPTAAQAYTATLTLTGAAGYSTTLTLTGTGITPSVASTGTLTVSSPASPFTFPAQSVGSQGTVVAFTVTNTVGSTVTLVAPTLTGTDAADFAITYPSSSSACFNGTSYATLLATQTCVIDLSFFPTIADSSSLLKNLTANLVVSDGTSGQNGSASLIGAPTSPLSIALTSGTLTMQVEAAQTAPAPAVFTVTNNGAAISSGLTFQSNTAATADDGFVNVTQTNEATPGNDCNDSATPPVVCGLSNSRQLTAAAGATTPCNGALAAGASCTVSVSLGVTVAGIETGNLAVGVLNTAGGFSGVYVASALISGTVSSQPLIGVTPATYDFGTEALGSSTPAQVFTLTNNGGTATGTFGTPIFAGTRDTDFTITANTCTGAALNPAGSCTISVVFSPSAAGPTGGGFGAGVTISVNDGSVTGTLDVSGNGVAVGAGGGLTVTPSSFTFASVVENSGVGAPATYLGPTTTVTIHNASTGNQTLNTFAGMDSAFFSVFTGTGTATTCTSHQVLAAGASCVIEIQEIITAAGTPTAVDMTVGAAGGFGTTASYVALNGTVQRSLALTGISLPVATGTASGNTFHFPATALGSSTAVTFQVTNAAIGDNWSAAASVTPALSDSGSGDSSQFAISADTCTSLTGNGQTCTFVVTFTPAGNNETLTDVTLTVIGTDAVGNTSTIAWGVDADGVKVPEFISADAGSFVNNLTAKPYDQTPNIGDGGLTPGDDFLGGAYNTNGLPNTTFTITNDGGVASDPLVVSLPVVWPAATGSVETANGNFYTPPAGAPFYILAQGSATATDCFSQPAEITPGTGVYGLDAGLPARGGDCTIAVDEQASTSATPGLQTGTLQVTAGGASATFSLKGWVNNSPILTTNFTGSLVDFGTLPVGSESASAAPIVVTNNSRSHATGVLQTVLSDQSNFIITSDTCAGSTLAVDQATCEVDVYFTPTSGAVAPATVTVTDTGTSSGYSAGSTAVTIQGNP